MSDELKQILEKLNYAELQMLSKDLSMGSPLLGSMVRNRIEELETCGKSCAVCGSSLEGKDNVFSLIFGPIGFKKKAAFCAIDCLGYFIERLKQIKQKNKGASQSTTKN